MMDFTAALEFCAGHRVGALVTVAADGRPQTSNIAYAVIGQSIQVSVTADRAKTRNLLSDPRATLHVSSPDLAQWVALDGTATLAGPSTAPGDEVGQDLAALYQAIAGTAHPDWAEFHHAMVRERRMVLTLTPSHARRGGAS